MILLPVKLYLPAFQLYELLIVLFESFYYILQGWDLLPSFQQLTLFYGQFSLDVVDFSIVNLRLGLKAFEFELQSAELLILLVVLFVEFGYSDVVEFLDSLQVDVVFLPDSLQLLKVIALGISLQLL